MACQLTLEWSLDGIQMVVVLGAVKDESRVKENEVLIIQGAMILSALLCFHCEREKRLVDAFPND